MDEICSLLYTLVNKVDALHLHIEQANEAIKETHSIVENISQVVNGLAQKDDPHTPKKTKPPEPNPIIPWATAGCTIPPFACPTSLAPPAPVNPQATTTLAPQGLTTTIKVKAPEPFKGTVGAEAKQWAMRMATWFQLSQGQFADELDAVRFFLMNMEEQKITTLSQTTTTAAYAAKFQTLMMLLDWNNAALHTQFYKGLHWQVKSQLAQKDVQPCDINNMINVAVQIDNICWEIEASRPPRDNKSSTSKTSAPNKGTSTGSQSKP
ncbi:unnamed protein product [Rhizoctonia solani]|uniref:Retrotransposon gag domain-containing protein n=1 Tax=Rhizoctonia solani TaxID=456999 RepID=A0A8H2WEE9_9AGAM|nr:unnamed protein product [Rhizoctonia solani]